jgi:hypothetical protein
VGLQKKNIYPTSAGIVGVNNPSRQRSGLERLACSEVALREKCSTVRAVNSGRKGGHCVISSRRPPPPIEWLRSTTRRLVASVSDGRRFAGPSLLLFITSLPVSVSSQSIAAVRAREGRSVIIRGVSVQICATAVWLLPQRLAFEPNYE